MKKIIIACLIVLGMTGVASASWYNPFSWFDKEIVEVPVEVPILGATYLFPYQGGLGTSTAPSYGQMPVGNSGGTYTLTATSSLGITAAGDGGSNWLKETNYGVSNLTASTTIPYWAKDAFYASSTSVFQGLATFGNASTSQISASSGSYLGTVFTGTWNGTSIADAYVDNTITLTNITQITNRAITDLTGTLTVSNGGTGVASFTSSQLLYGNGTAALSSVATTSVTIGSGLSYSGTFGSVVGGVAGSLTLNATGDWTGTIDGNNFAGGAIGAGELIYGGSAGSFSELAVSTNGYVLALSGGVPAWVGTTTAGTGLTYTGGSPGNFSVNTSQNIATLSNLTSNGFVKTGGGTGALSVDTSTYLTSVTMYPAFTYATSSAWTGTTTIPLAPAYVNETWNGVKCFTDAGTLNVSFYDGTNRMDLLNASTTVGTFTLSTNNTFTASEKRYVDIGTPASSPTKISCTVSKT